MASLNKTTLTVVTSVQAPIEKVWQYWTQPAHITQWNNASDDWHTPTAENDLCIGGTFLSRMEAKDGSFGFDFSGEYTNVVLYQAIDYIMEDGRAVSIRFKEIGDSTEISETFDPETENSLEMQQEGWQAILDNFKQYVESVVQ